MSLYNQWQDTAFEHESEDVAVKFWNEYCAIEKTIYEKVLDGPITTIKGEIANLAKEYEVDNITFMGFVDGINTSIDPQINLDGLEENSTVELNIDLEKLYYNMLVANAEWLYNLPQWDNILDDEKRNEIKKSYNSSKTIVKEERIGRNEPCPCGSGKKYKKCCGK